MELHYQLSGAGQPLVILHGLFGSLDNWRGIAKQLSEDVQVITVDLRNHGRSPHSDRQDYALMVADLKQLLADLNLEKIDLIGHSIGGKVAMAFAHVYPETLNRLMVVDIAPRQYPDEHSQIFQSLLTIDLPLYQKRSEVDQALEQTIKDKAVRQFLLMNLNQNNEGLSWRMNLPALQQNYPKLLESVGQDSSVHIPACFVKGGRSSYIKQDDEDLIKILFPEAEIVSIAGAGHWLHAEAPVEFLNIVRSFFAYASPKTTKTVN